MSTARLIVICWVESLTDRQILELRHAGSDWCEKMRNELRKMAAA